MSIVLGIDVGATGTKGNLVDTAKGELVSERFKLATPKPSTPAHVLAAIKEIITHFDWKGKDIGIGFPSIIHKGRCLSASNIDKSWLGFNIEGFFNKEIKGKVTVINDADAAGMAELHYGAAKDVMGTIILLTLGTGIGSAFFIDGRLVPNTELGHLKWKKSIAEHYASNSAREYKGLSYEEWGKELKEVLLHIEHLFSPDMIILGGGISKKFHKYFDYIIGTRAEIVPAEMRNEAGIVGAAMGFKMLNS